MTEEKEERKKIISIRGIDTRLYEELGKIARELGKTVGEMINEAITLFITLKEGLGVMGEAITQELEKTKPTIIGDIEELKLTAKDLEETKGKIIIKNVKKLELTEDITPQQINEKIRKIIKVDELIIPKTIPKTQILTKAIYIKKITEKQ